MLSVIHSSDPKDVNITIADLKDQDEDKDSLYAQVDMLLDAEAEVAVVGEVLLPQLVLLHLEATLEDLLSLHEDDEDKIQTPGYNKIGSAISSVGRSL